MLANYYLEIKLLHMSCAALSFLLYTTRGIWMLTGSRWHSTFVARRLPHWNDALLLTMGILLTMILRQYPGTHDWLTAKLIALLVHIGLGFVAFRGPESRRVRVTAWLGSLLAFGYIVAVALTRQPLPFLSA
ncbi:MAG: hypothetical protein Kow006_04200 [Gammaproteobacteria bacterium]